MPREYAQAAGKRGELSNAFPWRLDNVIGDLVLDEAHFAKNIQSNTHGSIAWLRARFLILVSATPCINHIRDFTGFLHLIQPKNLWSKANLEKLGIDEHTNIYADSFNDDRPGYEEIRRLRYTAFGYMKWIANENNPTTASHYLSQVWKKCFLRRTYTSRIPFNTGRQIGAEIPPMHTTCLETSFTMEEQKQYDPLRQMLQAQLAKRLESGKIVWNMKTFRRLILLGTWLGLDYCEQSMPSARTGKLLADPHTIWRLLQMCHQRDPEQFPMVDKRDHPALIAAVLRDSPKLRALVKVVSRQVLVQGEKAIIWVLFPAQQVLITKLFQLLNIDARALNRSLEYEARRDLIRDFQETTNKCMVLIPTYFMGSYGQNFQFQCHNTHLFDPAPSDPIRLQAIHRCRRIQQLFYVIVVEYYLSYSFNDYHYAHNIRKALPGVMAELNSRLIAGSDGDDVGDEVVLGKWAIYGGRLTPFAEIPMDVADKVIVLDAESLVRAILEEQHGERVVVEEKEEFSWLTAE